MAVAVLFRLPMRKKLNSHTMSAVDSLKFGFGLILCMFVSLPYAFVSKDSESRDKNEVLLNYTLQVAAQAGKFVIIPSGFNNALRATPCVYDLRARGVFDTVRWARQTFPHAIQPTCGNALFNDTMFLSEAIFQYVEEAKVLGSTSLQITCLLC